MDGDDTRDSDGHKYRVRSEALHKEAFAFAQDAGWRLAEIAASVTGCREIEARVLPSGTVRTELFARDAGVIARMLCGVAGGWEKVAGEWAERGYAAGSAHAADGGELDPQALLPTWHTVVPGVDYKPGLVEAFRARALLRAALCACLPNGPVAVSVAQCKDGRGVVRLDLTPSDADRIVALLVFCAERLEQCHTGRS